MNQTKPKPPLVRYWLNPLRWIEHWYWYCQQVWMSMNNSSSINIKGEWMLLTALLQTLNQMSTNTNMYSVLPPQFWFSKSLMLIFVLVTMPMSMVTPTQYNSSRGFKDVWSWTSSLSLLQMHAMPLCNTHMTTQQLTPCWNQIPCGVKVSTQLQTKLICTSIHHHNMKPKSKVWILLLRGWLSSNLSFSTLGLTINLDAGH